MLPGPDPEVRSGCAEMWMPRLWGGRRWLLDPGDPGVSVSTEERHHRVGNRLCLWAFAFLSAHVMSKTATKQADGVIVAVWLSHVRLCHPMDCRPAGSSVGFSRQEYCSGLPCPLPGALPEPGIEPGSPTLQADSLLSEPPVFRSKVLGL